MESIGIANMMESRSGWLEGFFVMVMASATVMIVVMVLVRRVVVVVSGVFLRESGVQGADGRCKSK